LTSALPNVGTINFGTINFGTTDFGTTDFGTTDFGTFNSAPLTSAPEEVGTVAAVGNFGVHVPTLMVPISIPGVKGADFRCRSQWCRSQWCRS
jgi:hypothetical protein